MAKNERFLTVDIGATSIKLGEFEINATGQLSMTAFAHREYEDELSEENRMGVVEGVLRQMILESGVKARRTLLSLSGQSALMRFGRITNMKNDKKQIRQLAEFEAKRNLPFALEDICLDYQLIAPTTEEGENSNTLDVMSVVLKRDLVEQYTQIIRNVGLRPVLIDLAPVASYNCARANGIGETNSSLLISIGGRSTNLLFIEGDRFFARSIPIAGYSITQQIAKEFGIGMPEAEELKRHHGYVDLGKDGADNSESASHIAKIVRNVMSRLHGEISRSINIYRSQQGGTSPQAIYLTGGSSILTYCDLFFNQKFNITTEYFNPLTIVSLGPAIDRDKLSLVAHMFSEVIGLAVRYVRPCPVEINLLPRKVMRQQHLSTKTPYFVAAMICLLAMVFVVLQGTKAAASQSAERAKKYSEVRSKLEPQYNTITGAISDAESAVAAVTTLKDFMLERTKWPLIVEEIFRAKPSNVWIDNITPVMGTMAPVVETTVIVDTSATGNGMDEMMGMDMSMMGMDMDMGIMGSEMGAQTVAKMAIAGFEINAHTISSRTPMLAPPALPPEPDYPFEVSEGESSEETAPEGNPEENAEGEEEGAPAPQQMIDNSGEGLFVHNLRQSRLFSNDVTLTAMKSRVKSMVFDNGADFDLQVKLEVPMEAYPWQFKTAQNRNGMGGMGGAAMETGRSRRRRGRD